MTKGTWVTSAMVAISMVGAAAYWSTAHADPTPTPIQIAIPGNVVITVGGTRILFIGQPTSTSTINCSPGTPQPQTVVAVNPSGGSAAQITGVLAFHDHEVSLGSRYLITGGPNTCGDFGLYTAEVN